MEKGTWYAPGSSYYGACSFPKSSPLPAAAGSSHVTNGVSRAQWFGSKICGACIQVQATGSGSGSAPYPANSYLSFVTDTDDGSIPAPDIDTAKSSGDLSGRWEVNWKMVDCPVGNTYLSY